MIGGRPLRPTETDLRWIAALCSRNGEIEESGVAAAVLGHPAKGIAWLANKLAGRGVDLAAGEILLSGSFIRPIAANPGDTIHADYGVTNGRDSRDLFGWLVEGNGPSRARPDG